jgi:hypothetical protein
MQETAALTVVDTFIRERLCNICQQEEDIQTILGYSFISKFKGPGQFLLVSVVLIFFCRLTEFYSHKVY